MLWKLVEAARPRLPDEHDVTTKSVSDRISAEPVIRTAADLQFMTFAPIKYIVPGLIVEGCVLLAGRPKVCKSWLALDVGLALPPPSIVLATANVNRAACSFSRWKMVTEGCSRV